MAKIVAIGGGDVRLKSTLKIDKEIINFSGKKKPKFLFIPTASSDSEGYYLIIKNYFEKLNCKVDVLYLTREILSKKEIEKKILNSDIVYVGGGNTLKMMTIWRRLGVDKIMQKALKKNIVLCGLSAGSICWFKYGNSDSRKFTSASKKLIKVSGLGFINALHCPHYDVEPHRKKDLKRMMKNSSLVSIAIENDCAIQIEDGKYKIIASNRKAKAYKVYWKNGKFFEEEIKKTKKFLSIKSVIKK